MPQRNPLDYSDPNANIAAILSILIKGRQQYHDSVRAEQQRIADEQEAEKRRQLLAEQVTAEQLRSIQEQRDAAMAASQRQEQALNTLFGGQRPATGLDAILPQGLRMTTPAAPTQDPAVRERALYNLPPDLRNTYIAREQARTDAATAALDRQAAEQKARNEALQAKREKVEKRKVDKAIGSILTAIAQGQTPDENSLALAGRLLPAQAINSLIPKEPEEPPLKKPTVADIKKALDPTGTKLAVIATDSETEATPSMVSALISALGPDEESEIPKDLRPVVAKMMATGSIAEMKPEDFERIPSKYLGPFMSETGLTARSTQRGLFTVMNMKLRADLANQSALLRTMGMNQDSLKTLLDASLRAYETDTANRAKIADLTLKITNALAGTQSVTTTKSPSGNVVQATATQSGISPDAASKIIPQLGSLQQHFYELARTLGLTNVMKAPTVQPPTGGAGAAGGIDLSAKSRFWLRNYGAAYSSAIAKGMSPEQAAGAAQRIADYGDGVQ